MKINLLKDFYTQDDKLNHSKPYIIIRASLFYALSLVIAVGIIGILNFVLKNNNVELLQPRNLPDRLPETSFVIIIVGPLIEEIAFRLGLSFKKKNLLVAIPFLCFFILSSLVGSYKNFILLKLVACILVFISLLFTTQEYWTSFNTKFGKAVIIVLALTFGWMHILNYDVVMNYLPLYFIVTLPQVIMGITFTYLRLNIGFWIALAGHMSLNGFSVLFTTFSGI